MSLGNLHQRPNDPTKTIRTGLTNASFVWDWKQDLRYYGILAAIALGSFLGHSRDMTTATDTASSSQQKITALPDTSKLTIKPLQP